MVQTSDEKKIKVRNTALYNACLGSTELLKKIGIAISKESLQAAYAGGDKNNEQDKI